MDLFLIHFYKTRGYKKFFFTNGCVEYHPVKKMTARKKVGIRIIITNVTVDIGIDLQLKLFDNKHHIRTFIRESVIYTHCCHGVDSFACGARKISLVKNVRRVVEVSIHPWFEPSSYYKCKSRIA